MAITPSSFAKIAAKSNESVKDFRWTSASQITMPASIIEINGSLYTSGDLVFDFANGTGDNGLDTGVEQSAKWYALYAVPGVGTAYKLKASLNLPAEAGGAGPVGFSSYRYLGLFANGQATGGGITNTSDIIKFIKNGEVTMFSERLTGVTAGDYANGKLLIVNSQAPPLVYTISVGMNSEQLPFDRASYYIYGACASPGQNIFFQGIGGTGTNQPIAWATGSGVDSGGSTVSGWMSVDTALSNTIRLNISAGPTVQYILSVGGWIDPILARRKN